MNQNWEEFMASLYHVPWRKKTKITKTKTKTKKHGINITIIILHATYTRMSVNVTTVTYISFNQPKPIVESHAFRPPTDKTAPGVQIVECGTKSERWGEGGERKKMRQEEVPSLSPPIPASSLFWLLTSFCTVPSIETPGTGYLLINSYRTWIFAGATNSQTQLNTVKLFSIYFSVYLSRQTR